MKTAKENMAFHAIGERLQELILAALPDSGAAVRYDESAELYRVNAYGRERELSVALDSPAGALKDIGKFLSRKL